MLIDNAFVKFLLVLARSLVTFLCCFCQDIGIWR